MSTKKSVFDALLAMGATTQQARSLCFFQPNL
jgi:hypothetical protein